MVRRSHCSSFIIHSWTLCREREFDEWRDYARLAIFVTRVGGRQPIVMVRCAGFCVKIFDNIRSVPTSFDNDILLVYSTVGSRPSDRYFRSVCLSVCLCRVFLSRLWSDLDQTSTYVTCPGLVVSPRIYELCDPWGLGDPPPKKLVFLGVWGRPWTIA